MALSYWIERAIRGLGEARPREVDGGELRATVPVAVATGVSAILSAQADRRVAHTLEVQAQASELAERRGRRRKRSTSDIS